MTRWLPDAPGEQAGLDTVREQRAMALSESSQERMETLVDKGPVWEAIKLGPLVGADGYPTDTISGTIRRIEDEDCLQVNDRTLTLRTTKQEFYHVRTYSLRRIPKH